MAPVVNLVFVLFAILTQLFLKTKWGQAASAWMCAQRVHVEGDKGISLGTEQRRLLTETPPGSGRLYSDTSEAQNESQASMPNRRPSTSYVELADAHHLLRQTSNVQSD